MISIFSLVYKSPEYADFIYNAIIKNTPKIKTGEAEFVFVVNFKNGISEKVVEHLKEKNYLFHVYEDEPEQPNYPDNMSSIYKAWNFAVAMAGGEKIVLLNSDMFPSSDSWLEKMLEAHKPDIALTARLVESGKMKSGTWGIEKNFGRTIKEFEKNKKDFKIFARTVEQDLLMPSGLYMPVMLETKLVRDTVGYPKGNPIYDGREVSGDWYFFNVTLKNAGIRHMTAGNTCFYHFQEGETFG